VTATTHYSGALAFSVGCHSGLNVPDEDSRSPQSGTDWAQAFLRQGATFIGNTGYGYGDSDLIAYSERLMLNFVEELGDWTDGPQTVGGALMQAKQRYYNTAAAGSLSNYDEKVLGEMTLYGLPMLQVNMPLTTTTPRTPLGAAGEVMTTSMHFSLAYMPHTVSDTIAGTYYTVVGAGDVLALAGRPAQPLTSADIHVPGTIAHGALLVGGTFADQPIDPLISRVITEGVYAALEPLFPTMAWYPSQIGVINSLLLITGRREEQLVLVPGQFLATTTATPTVGIQRLYSDLDFVIYHAPVTVTDFAAPRIWQAEALSTSLSLRFRVWEEDGGGAIQRTVVLYRRLHETSWSRAELAYDPATDWAEGSVPPVDGPIEYFVQAVDAVGNVALFLDHGNPFRGPQDGRLSYVHLPLVMRNHVSAPDLVVERIAATRNSVQIAIRNQGDTPAQDAFWVDLYINPYSAPTHVNQIWPNLSSQGLVWGVTAVLQAGEVLTLTVNDTYYAPGYSHVSWPLAVGTPVYAQVDSANTATTYGAVLESHEILGQTYNNILGSVVAASTTGAPVPPATGSHSLVHSRYSMPVRE
jgi:hypothetical protein